MKRARARIRLAIVEDHTAIAHGLATLLERDDVQVVGVAATRDEAAELIMAERPDVVLCDVMLGGRDDGFDLLDRLGDRTRFLMLSAYDYPAHHARAVEGGAAGYLSKVVDADRLAATVRAVARGGSGFTPDVIESARRAPRAPTPREMELVTLLGNGATNEEIAQAMSIAVKTVEGMLRRLFDRYAVANRTQLLQLANAQGWLVSTQAPAGAPSTATLSTATPADADGTGARAGAAAGDSRS